MATFQVQIEDMIGVVETTAGSGSSDTTALSSFLTDGAKEVINMMPSSMLITCATEQTFTPKAVGSEDETLNTTKIFNVRRNDGTIDQPCRLIMSSMKGRASDPLEMDFASETDPVYYLENNKINILPSASTAVGKYSEVQFPSVAHGDSPISTFPDARFLNEPTTPRLSRGVAEKSAHNTVNQMGQYRPIDGPLFSKEQTHFTGISAPFEPPKNPELEINTSTLSVDESAQKVLNYILPKIKNRQL